MTVKRFNEELLGKRVATKNNKLGVVIGYQKGENGEPQLLIIGMIYGGWVDTYLRKCDMVLLPNPYEYYYYIQEEDIEVKLEEVKDNE